MPQMGPLPWFFLLSLVLSSVLVFVCIVYFLGTNLTSGYAPKDKEELYKWGW